MSDWEMFSPAFAMACLTEAALESPTALRPSAYFLLASFLASSVVSCWT
jgi:hypothetical protein